MGKHFYVAGISEPIGYQGKGLVVVELKEITPLETGAPQSHFFLTDFFIAVREGEYRIGDTYELSLEKVQDDERV